MELNRLSEKYISILNKIIELYPENREVCSFCYLYLGKYYQEEEKIQSIAIKHYETIIKEYKDTYPYWYCLFIISDLYRGLEDYNKALEYIDMALKEPEFEDLKVKAFYEKAYTYLEMRKIKEAEELLNKIIAETGKGTRYYEKSKYLLKMIELDDFSNLESLGKDVRMPFY